MSGSDFLQIGQKIGLFLERKEKTHGNSYNFVTEYLKLKYPNGLPPDMMDGFLAEVRIVEKLSRMSSSKMNRKDLDEEDNPWWDIAGIALCQLAREVEQENSNNE